MKLSGCGLQNNNHSSFLSRQSQYFSGIERTPTKSMLLSSKITKKYLINPFLQQLRKSLISDLIAKGQPCPTSSGPPHVSLVFDIILPRHPFQAAYFILRLVPLPVLSVDCLMCMSSKSSDEEKEMF